MVEKRGRRRCRETEVHESGGDSGRSRGVTNGGAGCREREERSGVAVEKKREEEEEEKGFAF